MWILQTYAAVKIRDSRYSAYHSSATNTYSIQYLHFDESMTDLGSMTPTLHILPP
jgi:hypothetical protein